MVIGELRKVLIGFGAGISFILLSGLLTGGILFADFLLNIDLLNNFLMFGIPYGFIAGLIFIIFIKFRRMEIINSVKIGILFGIGFWLIQYSPTPLALCRTR